MATLGIPWVSVGGMTVQTGVVVLEPADEGEEGEGTEGSRITDRIEAFARVRAYPAKEPPPQGRRTALATRRGCSIRMCSTRV